MFDNYVIVADSLETTPDGYRLRGRIPYYRGLGLSMVDVYLTLDGEEVPRDAVTFTVHDASYKSDAMGEVYDDRWGFTEDAVLDVARGLSPGPHEVTLKVALRVSYNPHGSGATDTKILTAA